MNPLNILSRLRVHRPPVWRSVGLTLLALWAGPVAQAGDDVYTWKDATGRVHYGNRPPEGQAATPIPVQPTERIYSWTDAEGKIHYGAHPPPDIQAREMKEDDGSLSTIHAGQLRSGERQLLQQGR
ncbi:MAG TPA: hypothetical protein DCS21_06265 [Gammaproteobacteria bacterium]|nr:hypothetical protein [Gammaproteobacteria bacterium]